VYRFLRDEVGTSYMQFIPCVEPRQFERSAPAQLPANQLVTADSARAHPGHPMSVVTDWSVESEAWGSFLSAVFDEWQAHDQGRVKINLFESLFAQLNGQPSLMCTSSPFCGKNVALEHDGRVVFVRSLRVPRVRARQNRRPNVGRDGVPAQQLEFGLDKHNSLPSGIGPWAASHIYFRGAAPLDELPTSEPRVLHGLASAYRLEAPSEAVFRRIATGWRPFRMWVCVLLMRHLARSGGWHAPELARERAAAGRQLLRRAATPAA
jgi:hypothetical protein